MTTKKTTFSPLHFSEAGWLLRLWAAFRHQLLYVFWSLMEVALIVPLAFALMPWLNTFSPARVLAALLLLMLTPFFLIQFFSWLHLPTQTQRWFLITAMVLIILAAIPIYIYELTSIFNLRWIGQMLRNMAVADNNLWQRDIGLAVLIAFTWWRGMLFFSREVDVVRFGTRFRRSGLIFAPLTLILAAFRLEWSVISYILLFLFAGLTAAALTRVEQAETMQNATLDSISFRWLFTILSGGFITIIVASLFSLAISGSTGVRVGGFLAPIWLGVRFALSTILFTVSYLLSPLLPLIEKFISGLIEFFRSLFAASFEQQDAQPAPDQAAGQNPLDEILQQLEETSPDELAAVFGWRIFILIVLLVIIIGVTVYMVRRYRRNKTAVSAGRLARAIQGLRGRIQNNQTPKFEKEPQLTSLDWRAAITIKRIYAQLCAIAAEFGHGRAQNETPYEYLDTLVGLWPQNEFELKKITLAYVKVRYGELPETVEAYEEIKASWRKIEQISRQK